MKLIKKELLDTPLYVDKDKKVIAKDKTNTKDHSVRSYFVEALDTPSQKEPLTRDKLKAFNAVESALVSGDFISDEAHFQILKNHIDSIPIINRYAYEAIVTAIDSAEEYKPIQ